MAGYKENKTSTADDIRDKAIRRFSSEIDGRLISKWPPMPPEEIMAQYISYPNGYIVVYLPGLGAERTEKIAELINPQLITPEPYK